MVESGTKLNRTVGGGRSFGHRGEGLQFFNPNFLPLVGLGDPMLVYIKLNSATSSTRINNKIFSKIATPPPRKLRPPPVGEKLWYPLLVVLVVVE